MSIDTQLNSMLLSLVKVRPKDSPTVMRMQNEIEAELYRDHPSEEFIVAKLGEIASQLYRETQAKEMIVAQIARKRAMMMEPQKRFNCDYFSDLVSYIKLHETGKVILHTKVETEIEEGDEDIGSY